ncbi:4-hydroxy-tetrahydrodipicolinate reductase [uncultured Parasutterella sp.]|uniref:4-hydroxy-tetrahydrodipicolinate reductase n=1 Tax=uncultured Parasutterella sp. TaxID=1263098 RepID=UPI002593C499|nr:4-hydroxy-tetrahydrodipicolinate reductase [uncultured Parasutterella sp.]
MVKIAVAGAKGHVGKMIIDAVWNTEGAELVCALAHKETDHVEANEDAGASLGFNSGVKISCDNETLRTSGAQVLIDFTRPEGTMAFLDICKDAGIAMVIGTTGLNAEQKQKLEEASKVIPIVFAPNMSTGVNVTNKLLAQAAKLLKDYDCEIVEMHHSRKVDAPSGTAIAMGKVIAEARGQNFEDVAVWARQGHTGPRVPGSIGFAALRGGDVVGDHQVIFAGPGERIVISHLSSSRAGYAEGSVKAAQHVVNQKPGLYSMDDVLGLK